MLRFIGAGAIAALLIATPALAETKQEKANSPSAAIENPVLSGSTGNDDKASGESPAAKDDAKTGATPSSDKKN